MARTRTDKSNRKASRRGSRARRSWTVWLWAVVIVALVAGVFGLRFWQLRAASSNAPEPSSASEGESTSDDLATGESGTGESETGESETGESETGEDAAAVATQGKSSAPKLHDSQAPGPAPEGMVWVPGGRFWMGDGEYRDAMPEHLVDVDGFWMDQHEVTNAEFARFVEETGYKTVAELPLDPKDFPTLAPEELEGVEPGSIVFNPPPGPVSLDNHLQWWSYVPGATWQHPTGPDSTIEGLEDHPAVHISWRDAMAYTKWAGKRLPTEAEWELAARGGLDRAEYCWGNSLRPGADWEANIWQGNFPNQNSEDDGFRQTAPVGSFAPNGYGLYDVSGNVWEWCADWYRPDYYRNSPQKNPTGPDSSFDPQEPGIPKRVQRGGSFMCADSYCRRYVPGARGKGDPSSAAGHIGFRCVKPAE